MGVLDNIAYVPCHEGNHGGKYRDLDAIQYIVVHYTGNDGDTDANNAAYYAHTKVGASAHYFVDDDSITQSVKDTTIAWAVGGKKWSDCGKTGGGTLYGVCTNSNSISVELCDTRRNGTLDVTEATLANAVELIRLLMSKYNIPIERVVRHFDVNGKHCPAYFMDADKWAAFKQRLVESKATLTCSVTLPVLRQGAKGGAVETLQRLLNARGARLTVDGSFGPLTAAAVETYQRANGLTPDRCVGPATWAELVGG